MKSRLGYVAYAVTTGFVVMTFYCMLLYYPRAAVQMSLRVMSHLGADSITTHPAGLIPEQYETEPNGIPSSVYASMQYRPVAWGLRRWLLAKAPGEHRTDVYHYDPDDQAWVYYDHSTGLIVSRFIRGQKRPDGTVLSQQVDLYAGPDGVASEPNEQLGRFLDPLAERWLSASRPLIYDKQLARFFEIDFYKETVRKGSELDRTLHAPTQIGSIEKNGQMVGLHLTPPRRRLPDDKTEEVIHVGPFSRRYVPILDKSGRIDLLNRDTFEITRGAAALPCPMSLVGTLPHARPQDVLAFQAQPVAIWPDDNYRGMIVATAARDGMAMTVGVFDSAARMVRRADSEAMVITPSGPKQMSCPDAVMFHRPWGPALTVAKYLLENLHPPILSLLSYRTASSVEAVAGHQSIFVLPNSFVAMVGREQPSYWTDRLSTAGLIILPSILLSILLASCVNKDAKAVGFSESTRTLWVLCTFVFGVPAYVTYRFSRPEIKLVTCPSCGRARRPDMAACHLCGAPWETPDLTPPTWRVLDTAP